MSVVYTEHPDTRTVELVVNGRVTQADFDRISGPLQTFIDAHGSIKLIEIIEQLDGFDASMVWDGMKFDFKNLRHISHCAVVSDIGWLSPLTKAAGAVVSTKLRTFALDEIDAARAWIADPDAAT